MKRLEKIIGDREEQKSQVSVKGGGGWVILLLRSMKKEVTCLYMLQDGDQKLPEEGSTGSPEVLTSTSAPELLTTPSMGKSDNSDLKSSLQQSSEKPDLQPMSSTDLKKTKSNAKISENAVNRASGAYQKIHNKSPYNQSLENLYLKRGKRVIKAHKRTVTHPPAKPIGVESDNPRGSWDDNTKAENPVKQKTTHSRSHSQPSSHPPGKMRYEDPLFDKVRNAKKVAENAIKVSINIMQATLIIILSLVLKFIF